MTSFEPDGVYAGIPYRVLADNSIEAMLPGGLVKFKNLDQLLASVNGPPIDVTRSFDVLGNADTRNGGLPALARPLDYYSLLLDAIKKAERNSAQLRALVYERARFNFKRDILFGHSSLGMADLVRHINDFELAVARIEATADIDEPSTAYREQEIDEPSTAYREREIDERGTAYRANEYEAAVDHDEANASKLHRSMTNPASFTRNKQSRSRPLHPRRLVRSRFFRRAESLRCMSGLPPPE